MDASVRAAMRGLKLSLGFRKPFSSISSCPTSYSLAAVSSCSSTARVALRLDLKISSLSRVSTSSKPNSRSVAELTCLASTSSKLTSSYKDASSRFSLGTSRPSSLISSIPSSNISRATGSSSNIFSVGTMLPSSSSAIPPSLTNFAASGSIFSNSSLAASFPSSPTSNKPDSTGLSTNKSPVSLAAVAS